MVDCQVSAVMSRDEQKPKEQLDIGIFISRAHFVSKAGRELHTKPPDEAKAPGDDDVVGQLKIIDYDLVS